MLTKPMSAAATSSELDTFMAAFDAFIRAAKRARARSLGDEALTSAQYDLLAPLLEAETPPGLRELARAAAVSAPTATRMIDLLEARGLVSRTRCADDRRAVRLALTADGEAAVGAFRAAMRARQRTLFE